MYDKLAGHDRYRGHRGPASFAHTYDLAVVEVPTHRPMVRLDQVDLIYKSEEAKFSAVVEDIVERNEKGQPGTGRHRLRREVRASVPAARTARRPAFGVERQAGTRKRPLS